jgi:hypothetical protein
MYQPRQPLIELSPRLVSKRLSEVELGQLLLAGEASSRTGLALRGDVLTERGGLIEGLFRLHDDLVSFERRELGARVVAIETAFVLEAELASAARRPAEIGDLLLSGTSGTAGVLVAGPWARGAGLLDLASAVARPYGESTDAHFVVTDWRLVEREQRSRLLYRRSAGESVAEERWREPLGEDAD